MTHLKAQLIRMVGIDIMNNDHSITITGNGTYDEVNDIIGSSMTHPYTLDYNVKTIKHRFSETYRISGLRWNDLIKVLKLDLIELPTIVFEGSEYKLN